MPDFEAKTALPSGEFPALSCCMTTKKNAPWKKPAPKGSRHTTLSAAQKRSAKAAAKHGGRSYPNLVDNMRAAAKKRGRKTT